MADKLETYTHGHHESVVSQHRKRTAAEAAKFLLPHLKPGMRLLDVGCGWGGMVRHAAEHYGVKALGVTRVGATATESILAEAQKRGYK